MIQPQKVAPANLPGLWQNSDFVKLWGAHTVSAIGSKVSFLALPLTAALVLQASPVEMGYLAAAGALPALLFGLLIGVWVDRQQRRRLLIWADVGRGALLLLIPLAAWLGLLQIGLLAAILFLTGALNLLFGAADHAYLPTLVRREQLVEANSKLEFSRSAAEIAGPTLAGWLIQAISAPLAIVVDALSFWASALFLALIGQSEAKLKPANGDRPLLHEMGDGLRLLLRNPILRAITATTATITFFNAALEALYLLYMTRNLGLSAGLVGIIFGVGSVGFLLGALLSNRMGRRLGPGPTMIAGLSLLSLADFILPLASGPQLVVIALLGMAQICFGCGLTFYSISQVSLRQSITPEQMLGRVNSALDFMSAGLLPLGALMGGLLGTWLGLRPTLLLAASGEFLAVAWLLFSPVRVLSAYSDSDTAYE